MIERLTGDDQVGLVGTQLDLFVVRVLDADGDPVPGATVRFRFEQGTGQLTATGPLTESSGLASTRLTLPLVAMEIIVSAAVGELEPVLFHAEAVEPDNGGG